MPIEMPWEQEQPKKPSQLGNDAAAGIRGATTTLVPNLIRVGTGLGSGLLSSTGVGMAAGGALAGGGEVLAQMLEKGTMDLSKINKGRVAVEAGLGAIPGGKLIKIGSAVKSALLGGGAAAAGVAGRKFTDEANASKPLGERLAASIPMTGENKGSEAFQVGLGGTLGGLISKWADKVAQNRSGLRLGKGEKPAVYKDTDVPHGPDTMADTFRKDGKWTPEAIEQAAQRLEVQGDADAMDAARKMRDAAVQAGKDDTTIRSNILRQREKDITQHAKNLNAADKYKEKNAQEYGKLLNARDKRLKQEELQKIKDRKALEAQSKVEDALGKMGNAEGKTSVSMSSTTDVPGGKMTARTVFTPPKSRGQKGATPPPDDLPGGNPPPSPPAPAPVPSPKPTKPPKTPRTKGTPGQVASKLAGEAEVPPPAQPVAAPPAQPVVPPAAPPVQPPAAVPPPLTGVAKLSAPTALRVGQELQDVPPGSVIARFFQNRDEASRAAAYANATPPNLPGTDIVSQLAGKAEASKALGRVENRPDLVAAGQKLWGLTSKVGKELGMPNKAQVSMPPKASAPVPPVKAAPHPVAPPLAPSSFPVRGLDKAQPISPQTKLKMGALKARMTNLEQIGKMDTPEYTKLVQEAETMQQTIFAEQFPELVADLKAAEQASSATSKIPAAPAPPSMKPRLNKKGRGPSSESGEIDPTMAVKLGMAGIGAASGAAIDEDDRLRGALLGGAAGYAGGRGIQHLAEGGKPFVSGDFWPNAAAFQRFNYLSDPYNLSYNTVLAPLGAATLGSLERVAVGAAEGDATKLMQGRQGLTELFNAYSPTRDLKERLPEAWNTAKTLIGAAERAEHTIGDSTSMVGDVLGLPGTVMSMGDVMARGALTRGGIPENIARAITVTANPRYRLSQNILNLAKNPVGSFFIPFAKTGLNVAESSFERLPIIGLAARLTNDPDIEASMAELAVRQGMGAAVLALSYGLGNSVDPAIDKQFKLRSVLSNMAGQYGGLVTAGFSAGQAAQLGRIKEVGLAPNTWGGAIREGGKAAATSMPLPTTRTIVDMVNSLGNYTEGRMAHPEAEQLTNRPLPDALTPAILPWAERMITKPKEAIKMPWEM